MEATIYNQAGKSAGNITLPESVFAVPFNKDLVHQVVVAMDANARTSIAHTKDRSEVRGGGKKPWKQKGTGRARHGSTRSPIWVGGGVAHGPRNEKDYSQKINKKMRTKALYCALSQKLKDNEVIFIDNITLKDIKTKDAKAVVSAIAKEVLGREEFADWNKSIFRIWVWDLDEKTRRSFRNLPNVTIGSVRNMNARDVLKSRFDVIVGGDEAVSFIEGKMASQKSKKEGK